MKIANINRERTFLLNDLRNFNDFFRKDVTLKKRKKKQKAEFLFFKASFFSL